MISASISLASSIPTAVLPAAVGPVRYQALAKIKLITKPQRAGAVGREKNRLLDLAWAETLNSIRDLLIFDRIEIRVNDRIQNLLGFAQRLTAKVKHDKVR